MREIWFVPFVNPDGYKANEACVCVFLTKHVQIQRYRVIELPVPHRLWGRASSARPEWKGAMISSSFGFVLSWAQLKSLSTIENRVGAKTQRKGGIRANLHLLKNHTLHNQFKFEISVLCQASVEKVIRKNRRPTCKSSINGGVDINRTVDWNQSVQFFLGQILWSLTLESLELIKTVKETTQRLMLPFVDLVFAFQSVLMLPSVPSQELRSPLVKWVQWLQWRTWWTVGSSDQHPSMAWQWTPIQFVYHVFPCIYSVVMIQSYLL